jgi:hypothetical protein
LPIHRAFIGLWSPSYTCHEAPSDTPLMQKTSVESAKQAWSAETESFNCFA